MEDALDLLGWLGIGLKLSLYVTSLLASGMALTVISGVVEADRARLWLMPAAWLSLSATFIAGLRVCLSSMQMGDMTMLAMVWDMQHQSVLATGAGFIAMSLAIIAPDWMQRGLALSGALALSLSFGLTGHTQALESPAFFPLLVAGHVLIAAFWFSAPLVLWPQHSLSDEGVLARTERFGNIALYAVPLLFIGGGVLAWKLGGGFSGLTTSTYGIALGAKLTAATAALGLGALNKLRVASVLKTSPDHGRLELKRTLCADAVLFMLALLAITLATTLFGPPMA